MDSSCRSPSRSAPAGRRKGILGAYARRRGAGNRGRCAPAGRLRRPTAVSAGPGGRRPARLARRLRYPAPPAARSSSASPPRISSGIGTEDGPEVSTSAPPADVSSPGVELPSPGPVPVGPPRVPDVVVSVGSRSAGRPGIGLALPCVRERAEDVLLRVRVVEHVHRQRPDRLLVAVLREDLVDPPVAVPVRDHLRRRTSSSWRRPSGRPRGRSAWRSQGATRGGGIGGRRRRARVLDGRGGMESPRPPWVGDQGRVNDV